MAEKLTTVEQLAHRLGRSERAIRRAAQRLRMGKVEVLGVRRWAFTPAQCDRIKANTHDGPGKPRKALQAV